MVGLAEAFDSERLVIGLFDGQTICFEGGGAVSCRSSGDASVSGVGWWRLLLLILGPVSVLVTPVTGDSTTVKRGRGRCSSGRTSR